MWVSATLQTPKVQVFGLKKVFECNALSNVITFRWGERLNFGCHQILLFIFNRLM